MEKENSDFKKIVLIAIIVGIIAGVGALLFFEGLKIATQFFMGDILGYQFPQEGQSIQELATWTPPPHIWLLLPIICLGGLLSGFLVYTFAPEAEGHGTDAAIHAFHSEGKVRRRIPLLKAVTSILTMATGGSAGREGPTAQISAGFGSMAADWLGLSPHYRRIALVTGIGAGIGTIFKAPLGGAILGAEILYRRDFESEAIIPSFLASIIGYAIFGSVEGFDPIFQTTGIIWSIGQLPLFLLLGVLCAGVGLLYVRSFYGTRHLFTAFFQKHKLPNHFKPALGALILGLFVITLSYISPDAMTVGLGSMGAGYGFLQLALDNMLPLSVLIFLPFAKILTTSLTIGSGGSGGVFAPGLVIGGMAGGALGTLLHTFFPALVPLATVPAFVIVGMIALFGSIANAPISVMIMVVEMTSDFSLLVPAMGAVAVSYVLTDEETIFREQVRNKAQSPAHRGEYVVEILEEIRARDVMVGIDRLITLSPDEPCERVVSLIDETWHTGFPVIEKGKLQGIVTIGDMRELPAHDLSCRKVRDCMTRKLVTITPETTLEIALEQMMDNNIHHIPIVDEKQPETLLGFLTSTDILRAYTHRMAERSKYKSK
jgi:CIC family chloride channel protein